MLPHVTRDSAMLATDAIDVGGEAHGKGCHVEPVPRAVRRLAEAQKFLPREAELAPIVGEIPVHEMKGKNVVSSRNRSVRGKHGALSDQFTGLGMTVAGRDELADPFHGEKSRVSLVAMPDSRIDAEGAQDAYASDA